MLGSLSTSGAAFAARSRLSGLAHDCALSAMLAGETP